MHSFQRTRAHPCQALAGRDNFVSVSWQRSDFNVESASVDFDGVTAELPVHDIVDVAGHAVMLARLGTKSHDRSMLVLVSSPIYLMLPASEDAMSPVFRLLAGLRTMRHFVRQRNHSSVPFIHKGQVPTGDLIRALRK